MEDQTNNEPAAGESANNEQTASELFDSALATIDVRDIKAWLSSLESETRGVTSRLTTIETEVVALKSTAEDRFKDTRLMWQAINERTEPIEARLDWIDETMQMLAGHESLNWLLCSLGLPHV